MLTSKESQINGMENLRKIDNEIPDSNAISKTCRVISKKYTFPLATLELKYRKCAALVGWPAASSHC
jgi:hypothetical protein